MTDAQFNHAMNDVLGLISGLCGMTVTASSAENLMATVNDIRKKYLSESNNYPNQDNMETNIKLMAKALISQGYDSTSAMLQAINTFGDKCILASIYQMYDIDETEYAKSLLKQL